MEFCVLKENTQEQSFEMINEWVMEITGSMGLQFTRLKTSVPLQNDNLIQPLNLQGKAS